MAPLWRGAGVNTLGLAAPAAWLTDIDCAAWVNCCTLPLLPQQALVYFLYFLGGSMHAGGL